MSRANSQTYRRRSHCWPWDERSRPNLHPLLPPRFSTHSIFDQTTTAKPKPKPTIHHHHLLSSQPHLPQGCHAMLSASQTDRRVPACTVHERLAGLGWAGLGWGPFRSQSVPVRLVCMYAVRRCFFFLSALTCFFSFLALAEHPFSLLPFPNWTRAGLDRTGATHF
ncbi:hypothetical protein HDK77DRAFT_217131 [Phyllosticta capitalensis]|uniref:uncharacterized protein n=1 Tax=Phyllosticta capitalensis TaxID=121624 RepID=UPI003130393B